VPPARPPATGATGGTGAQKTGWQNFRDGALTLFHAYANWLVSITWKRFVVLSILLVIAAAVLQEVPPFSLPILTVYPEPPAVAPPPAPPLPPTPRASRPPRPDSDDAVRIERKDPRGGEVTISINRDGVRITPRSRAGSAPGAAASAGASAAPSTPASASGAGEPPPPERAASASAEPSVEIRLPPGADSEAVREAVREARSAVVEAIREAQQEASEAAREAAAEAREAAAEATARAKTAEQARRAVRRVRTTRFGDFLVELAWLIIVASAILKITYKGKMQAEVKAAVATETAESEQLKRQVVEARMAAMQAQVEPHFLFNTLASIDHLIETDPPRASQMQKNLIALLRASMPSMRESHPAGHSLGREMAVVRPYVEILKVRMEDRLQADVSVPKGLLSAEFPPMMIQSLVENAIKHGLEPKAEGGSLSVAAEIVDGKLAVTVADTGLGFGKADTAGTGVGLANIRDRLKLLYGDEASLVITDNEPSGTVATITVPYQAQPAHAAAGGRRT
jgi:signal transduction histidine kinase